MSQHTAAPSESPVHSLKIWWLITGRVIACIMLMMLSATWSPEWAARNFGRLPADFLLLISSVCLLSALYALLQRFSSRLEFQVRLQLCLDMLLISWLVWLTGDVRSPYVALYMIVISIAGLYLGARDAMIAAIGCAAFYTFITLPVVLGFVPPYGPSLFVAATTTAESIQKIGLNDIAFFVVGLLAARLAQQRAKSDDQLVAATHALANLRALHERIIESMRSGVITTDIYGHIYSMNMAAVEITGYQARDLKGQSISLLFARIGEVMSASLKAAVTGDTIPRAESECSKPDGTSLHLGFSIVPLIAESGETTGLVVTFQDLTEIRALERQSRRQDQLAAIGRVSAGIAHEIRNPLAAMSGSIQMLRAELDNDSNSSELMEIVLRESERLNRIITDFLIYARPRPCELRTSDLREPLREMIALLRNSPETLPTHYFVESFPPVPLIARFDSAQMRQVFWNLAKNALQAMPNGGTISISIKLTQSGNAQITFTDTGCGMSVEQQEKLFEPFSSSKASGTGLGLSIVYQIIQDHKGSISVLSKEGAGTAFIIELPGGSLAVDHPDTTTTNASEELAPLYG